MLNKTTFLVVFLIFISCNASKRIITRYYLIEIPEEMAEQNSNSDPVLNAYCEIVPVDIYPAYSSRQIANRNKSHEITYYSYHKWAVRPEDSFTRILIDYYKKKRIFKDVAQRFWKVTPEYKLETTVYQLEIIDQNNQFNAHLRLEFRLLAYDTGELILEHAADEKVTLQERNINLLAASIGKIYSSELDALAGNIITELSTKP